MKESGIEADSGHSHPLLSGLPAARAKKGKVVSAEEAVRVIRDGDTIATGGFVGIGFADSDPNLPVPADLSISARTLKKFVSWGPLLLPD